MSLNPPPQVPQGLPSPQFFVRLVECVRLLFENARVNYTGAVTAGTTQTQAGATPLTGNINNVSTVANASDGVRLPTAMRDATIEILNTGANALQVWPATSDTIDGGAADAVDSNTLAAGSSRRYLAINNVDWITLSG